MEALPNRVLYNIACTPRSFVWLKKPGMICLSKIFANFTRANSAPSTSHARFAGLSGA